MYTPIFKLGGLFAPARPEQITLFVCFMILFNVFIQKDDFK